MSIVVSAEIGGERRVYTAEDMPLSIGGAACHLALANLSDDGPVAFLGHDRGELFIQCNALALIQATSPDIG